MDADTLVVITDKERGWIMRRYRALREEGFSHAVAFLQALDEAEAELPTRATSC